MKSIKVRFNLARGRNYMKWKVEYPDKNVDYHQFFAYAKTEKRAVKFCDDIQAFFDKIKELVD